MSPGNLRINGFLKTAYCSVGLRAALSGFPGSKLTCHFERKISPCGRDDNVFLGQETRLSREGSCVAITGERVFCHFDRREKSFISATCKTKISRLRLEMTLRHSLEGGNPEFG